jgi:hypothetical protein
VMSVNIIRTIHWEAFYPVWSYKYIIDYVLFDSTHANSKKIR